MKNKYEELLSIILEMEEEEKELKQQELRLFDEQVEETSNSIVNEAVKHFQKRFRRYGKDDFDERYFYTKKEFEMFKQLNQNPDVKFRTEYDEKIPNKIYCYIAYR